MGLIRASATKSFSSVSKGLGCLCFIALTPSSAAYISRVELTAACSSTLWCSSFYTPGLGVPFCYLPRACRRALVAIPVPHWDIVLCSLCLMMLHMLGPRPRFS